LTVEAFEATGRCIGAESSVAEGAISIGPRLSGMEWDEAWDRASLANENGFPVGLGAQLKLTRGVRLFLDGRDTGCVKKRV
jgi:hypothetical protein